MRMRSKSWGTGRAGWSVVRHRQTVTAAKLDQDLVALFDHLGGEGPHIGPDAPSPSDQATGRFVFLHRSGRTAGLGRAVGVRRTS